MIKNFVLKLGVFAIIGAGLGYAYYYFIGCNTGSCPLTSNATITTVYGLLIGLVLGFDSRLLKRKSNDSSSVK